MIQTQGEYHYLFKVVLVGNSCVGKSSIVVRYADNEFSDVFLATIGVDFRFKSFPLGPNKIKLQIWDTAGHERFRTITSSYYRGAHALMVVFDLADRQSYDDAINYWYGEVKTACPPGTSILLVGNKCDLEEKRAVSEAEVNEFVERHKEVQYIETSAKTAERIEEAFHKIAGMLVDVTNNSNKSYQAKRRKRRSEQSENGTIELTNQDADRKKYYCCNGMI